VITDTHWRLWALESATGHDAHGYPHVNVLHTPPRRGEVDEPSRPEPPGETDYMVARQIGKAVTALSPRDIQGSNVLVAWWGAVPSNATRTDRLRRLGFTYDNGRRLAEKNRAWVEGWVGSFREFHNLQ